MLCKKMLCLIAFFSFSFAYSQTTLEDKRKEIFESQTSCDQGLYTDENYFALSTPQNVVRVYSLADKNLIFEVSTDQRVQDIKVVKNQLYVLTGTQLLSWSLKDKRLIFNFKTHSNISSGLHWREKATGFIIQDHVAIVTHGVLGLTILDLTQGKILKEIPMPTISSAQDIDLLDTKTAVIAVDNDNEAEFRGLYVFDLLNYEVSKQIKIDNALPSAVRVLDQNRLMMIYFNAVWKFELDQALSRNEPQPTRRAWKFPELFLVDMVGKVAFDSKNLYACFKTLDPNTEKRSLKPLAVDLNTLNLQ